ncbi:MAG: heme ABC transporter ATP-binding protein [Bacteroidota bacterium]
MIRATELSLRIQGKTILDKVNCTVPPGKVTVAMGKNGAGKSTLLNMLAGYRLEGEAAGAVWVDEKAMQDYPPSLLATKRAVLAQAATLGFPLSVMEVVEIGTYNLYRQTTKKQRQARIDYYLDLLELTDLRDRSFPTLSGGEKKRVLLAKCLLQLDTDLTKDADTNRYLLLDEPTAALDIEQQYRFVQLATRCARERGMGVFAVLHDLNLAARFADELIFLRAGKVVAAGPSTSVLTKKNIQTTFNVDCLIQDHPYFDCPLITTLPYGKSNFAPACAP